MQDKEGYSDPYRILFPLGLFSGLLGILLWFLFQHRMISFYPRQSHANVMFMGLLWSFISGFLMTAVPKMLSTYKASFFEIFATVLLVFIQIALNVRNQTEYSVYLFGFQILFLGFFLIRRVLVKMKIPFEGFYFLPFAFFQGFLGIVTFIYEPNYSTVYLLSGQALVLNLILGLGSRLIPVISRCPNALSPDISSFNKNKLFVLSMAISLNTGFWLEAFYDTKIGAIIKLVTVLVMSFCLLDLHKKPTTFGFVGYALKLSVLLLVINSIIEVFWQVTIANTHILYIGVFLLVTLLVATRVMLAHGQQNLDYERDSKRLLIVVFLILLATLLRVLANANVTGDMMQISVLSGAMAIVLWGHKFVKVLKASR